MSRLRFIEGDMYSVRRDDKDAVQSAFFSVRAESVGMQRDYALWAVSHREYDSWYLERDADGGAHENEEQETAPLIIPDAIVATVGIVDHVRDRFLNPEYPERINDIARHLIFVSDADVVVPEAP